VGDGEGNVDAKEGSTTEVKMIPDAVDPRLGPKGFPSPVEQYHYHHRRARTSTSAPGEQSLPADRPDPRLLLRPQGRLTPGEGQGLRWGRALQPMDNMHLALD